LTLSDRLTISRQLRVFAAGAIDRSDDCDGALSRVWLHVAWRYRVASEHPEKPELVSEARDWELHAEACAAWRANRVPRVRA